jgi:DeoR family fructose operon transcriptional repressor
MAKGRKADQGVVARRPFPSERQREIAEALARDGFVDAAALSASLGVTGETVRKDLISLEGQGVLRRTHGGAVPVNSLSYEPDVAQRTEFAAEKARIAARALQHLPRNGAVLLDAGSTVGALVDLIPDDRNLTVFTNTLTVAVALAKRPGLVVYTLGGRVRGTTLAEVDAWALRALGELTVDVAFLGANGVSLERGLTTPDPSEAAVKRLMVQGASRRVLLADGSKFGHASTCRFAEIDDMDLVITDRRLDPAVVETVTGRGIEVEQA